MRKKPQILRTLGVIVGNRDIFPDRLAHEGGREVIKTLKELGFSIVTLFSERSGEGTLQTRRDSKKCADLFKSKADEIIGILVTLPNFGDEKSIVEAIRLSKLNVPVMVHAFPDRVEKMDRENRRDSFCGKFSLCNNLKQYGIQFTNTSCHVEDPSSEDFKKDVQFFGKVCYVVKKLRSARLGLIGVRPSPFNTVRYSEKILESEGISVETVSLSDILQRAQGMDEKHDRMQEVLAEINQYFSIEGVPREPIIKTAKLSLAILEWAEENDLDGVAVQCWPTIEKLYGIVPCAAISIITERSLLAACEADITGLLSMYALQLASGNHPALVDLNNNYGDSPDKFVAFHCSNFPRSLFVDKPKFCRHFALHEYGALHGKIRPGPITLFRISTDDKRGKIRTYIAEGEITDDQLETFGGYGVVRIKGLQRLLQYIANEGFEHHVAIVHGHVADILEEAVKKYLGWDFYRHM